MDTASITDYASVDGIEMYYEVHGAGSRPLVVLHGGVLTIDLTFGALLPALVSRRRVIAVELQGHGHTADTDREMSLANLSDDVVALLDRLGIERADFFGFSLGGLVSLETAVRHPERVDRLLLAATHHRPDGYRPEIMDPASMGVSDLLPSEGDFRAMREAYDRIAPDPGHFDAFLAKTSAVAAGFTGWTERQLSEITAPTLLVIGDRDFVRIEHAARMLELIPDARLAVLPDTTHMGLMTRTELLVPMLDTFLSTTD